MTSKEAIKRIEELRDTIKFYINASKHSKLVRDSMSIMITKYKHELLRLEDCLYNEEFDDQVEK